MRQNNRPKRPIISHPQVDALIASILATPTEGLVALLGPIDAWRLPRSDLNAWIRVHNKLDALLEDIIRQYGCADGVQTTPFTHETKTLLCVILKFERLLLENTTNRKLFVQYDRLNSLLCTSDLDVLVGALLLLLRPSQQYSSQPGLNQSLHISTTRLELLAKTVPTLREHGIEMVDLVSKKPDGKLAHVPQEASEVSFGFYRKAGESSVGESSTASSSTMPRPSERPANVFETPARPHAPTHSASSSNHHQVVQLGPLAQSSRTAVDIFVDAVKTYQVPKSEQYELFCRIRMAHALGAGENNAYDRETLVIARLLAISVYAHTHTEAHAQASIFLYDSDIVSRIADLLQHDNEVPVLVQMAAVSALDAIARYRGKIQEVLTAVNAGVNHGILMSLLRRTISEITSADSEMPNIFVDALLSFLTFIATHASGGNMIIGAGLVPLLIQIIGITHEKRLPIVSKAMQLIDNVLYAYLNAFTMFCNGRGIETLTDRIKHEVDNGIQGFASDPMARSAQNSHGLLPVTRTSVLKHLLRSMLRMMQSSGTTEGMRGLIDSSLLKSVENIIDYRGIFGPTVLPLAINIVATFVHNEPTSLTAIQEAKLPETIYRTLEAGIEPYFEVIQSVPNVLGALSLNQAGQEQLAARPSIIPALFTIFTSEKHLKVLIDKENAAAVGSSIDELIRHHPNLRGIVFESMISTLKKVKDLGSAYEPPENISQFYRLAVTSEVQEDVDMKEEAPVSGEEVAAPITTENASEGETPPVEDPQTKTHDNAIINFIDVICRFLEGLFQQPVHCKDFITQSEGLSSITALIALPCLPYDYANSIHSDALVHVIRNMVEAAPAEVLVHLASGVRDSLVATKDFWSEIGSESRLLPLVDIGDELQRKAANSLFQRLNTLHIRLTLLSDVHSTAGYSHARQAINLLQNTTLEIMPDLGTLHRFCIWENILLKNGLASKGLSSVPTASQSTEDVVALELAEEGLTTGTGDAAEAPAHPASGTSTPVPSAKKVDGPREKNVTALRHIASQLPNALTPFFQSAAKLLLYSRRNPEESQKKQCAALAGALSQVLVDHLNELTEDYDPTFIYAYHTVMIGLIALLLFDDRSPSHCHAPLLLQFYRQGGIDAVLRTCRRYTDAITRISKIKPSDRSESDQQELVHVYGGLKISLHLLSSLISFKPSQDPGQITAFISSGKPETHPDHYEPHDFLVKMRLAITPFIRDIWRSEWLVAAPPAVSKFAMQCIQDVIRADNEVPRQDFNTSDVLPSSGQGLLRPSNPPTEERITQLTDMGFGRSAAVRALTRTNNNVSIATEYLLSHPYDPADEEPANAPAQENQAAETAEPAAGPSTENENEGNHEPATETEGAENPEENEITPTAMETDEAQPDPPAAEEPPEENIGTAEERRKELDGLREDLKSDIAPLALRLADAHPALIFDVRQAFQLAGTQEYEPEAIRSVIRDIQNFSASAYDIHEEPLAVRCRLLALMLTDSPKDVMDNQEGKGLMDMLHAIILSQPIGVEKNQPLPKWLSALLLSMESLVVLSEEPKAVSLVVPEQEVKEPKLFDGPTYAGARATMFTLAMNLLQFPNVPRDELISSLRIIVQLTRDVRFAHNFIKADGVSILMQRLKNLVVENGTTPSFQSHIVIILRHLMEDKAVLHAAMKHEVNRIFNTSRSKTLDLLTFVRTSQGFAARDAQVFLDVTKEVCTLARPDVPSYQLVLRTADADKEKEKGTEKGPSSTTTEKAAGDGQMQIDSPLTPTSPSSDMIESVIHFMLGEVMRVGKLATEEVNNKEKEKDKESAEETTVAKPDGTSADPGESTTEDKGKTVETEMKPQDAHFYVCFLLKVLAELLFSYEQGKIVFLTYPKKHGQVPPNKDVFARSKSAALNYLLTELVTFGSFSTEGKDTNRKKEALCAEAINVIIALCIDGSGTREPLSALPDATSIRKLVLESTNRAIKDAATLEPVDIRYGKIMGLSDLCNKLLSYRIDNGTAKPVDDTPMHIAKIMLEKNFVATLTTVLTDIDLNYPNIRNLVTVVLRPLEYLTKIAIKMGRSDRTKESADKKSSSSTSVSEDEDDDEETDEDQDMETEDREETPDLYRNSSLGMYAGVMEEQYDEDEDDAMDEDEDVDDEGEIEYEESESENSENTQPDETEVLEDALAEGEIEEPANGWQDIDEDMRDEEGEEGDDDDDDLDDEDRDEEEMMWEGGMNDNGGNGLLVDEQDEDEDGEGDGIIDGDEGTGEDEIDMFSTADELAGDFGDVEQGDQFIPMELPFIGRQPARGTRPPGFGASRLFLNGPPIGGVRDGDPESQVFGRTRGAGALGPEALTHPLLVDTANLPGVAGATSRLTTSTRRPRGGVIPPNPYTDVLHTIEELIGGGAMQIVQELFQRTGLGAGLMSADVALEIPGGGPGETAMLINRNLERQRATRGATQSVRILRGQEPRIENAEFVPLQTLQRWTEEAKLSHGKHLQARVQNICNHIVLALLPEAREAAKVAKEKEEKERAEREKAEKEAEEAAAKEKAEKEEAEKKAELEKAEKEAKEAAEREAAENEQRAQAEARAEVAEVNLLAGEDTEMADATEASEARPSEAGSSSTTEATAGTSTAAPAERTIVTINGNEVDITDTGIDPTFLEALPDDMREEVLNQHFREQRANQAEQNAETQISTEFLDALPPEIRAEILREERLERSRRERQTEGGAPPIPADMGAADFIASLDPQLRQVVLLDSDENILQTLPSHMLAEAGAIRGGEYRQRSPRPVPPPAANVASPRKPPPARDAIQLLDRQGITTLVRLLFFPQLSRKTILHKVLLNLCENSKSRTELFNVLLSILQDGTGDLASVDKSFSQLTVRTPKGPTTPSKASGKQKDPSLSSSSPIVPNEVPPDLVAQRCLEALTFIVGVNELSSLFFLTEHELPASLKKTTSRKGKGKEKQAPQSHYPIVLLLGLLDRQSLLKTPAIMEATANLLHQVTRPLTAIKNESKPAQESQSTQQSQSAEQSQPSTGNVVLPSGLPDAAAQLAAALLGRSTPATDTNAGPSTSGETVEEKMLLANPPQIPHPALRSIVNILAVGECSGKTFQHTLALIQHLSHLPDAREVIANELRLRAHDFGQNLSTDLDALISALQKSEGQDDLPPSVIGRFSPASSDQAKLLRVLKTIDYMYSKSGVSGNEVDEDSLREIYETFRFTALWKKLGECLGVVEQKPDVEHIATVLLPLIEALMVVCKNVGVKSSIGVPAVPGSPRSPLISMEQSVDDLFVSFTDDHRKFLNLMVRNNPSLMSGSFSLLVKNPRVLDFDNKRNYFSQQLHKRPYPREHYGALSVNVRRARVFEDSFHAFQHKTGEQVKYGKLSVRFYAEEGVDAGGVTREWFQILARQMFNPNYALFEPCAADRQTYQPNRASEVNPDHLSYFKFVGRVIGKAIYDGRLMDAHFARSLYRQLLGKRVDYRDVEWVDPEYYKSLCWILENDPTVLDLTFITEVDEFGRHAIIPLKENGVQIPVTMENRKEYVQLSAQYRLYSSIDKQIDNLLAGFYEIIPKDLISIFNEQEVELLISGTPDIDIDEWRGATEYHGYSSSDPVIVWWWRALKSFNRDERAKVLSFATGTTRVPLSGFSDLQGVQGVQRFSIHRAYGELDRLPQAHTCFNQIDLPQYSSYEKLRQQLLLAINEGGEGFGFA